MNSGTLYSGTLNSGTSNSGTFNSGTLNSSKYGTFSNITTRPNILTGWPMLKGQELKALPNLHK